MNQVDKSDWATEWDAELGKWVYVSDHIPGEYTGELGPITPGFNSKNR